MTSDDQHFLDLLSIVPRDFKRYSKEVVDAIDRGFDHVALSMRENLDLEAWWPQSSRPPFLKTESVTPRWPLKSHSRSAWVGSVYSWIFSHHAWAIAITAFVGTGALIFYGQRRSHRQRGRAKRRLNGARKEVVVVLGSLRVPIARSSILDLERRGYIVYVVTSSSIEDEMVWAESKVDILPLRLNLSNPSDVHQAVEQLNRILRPRLNNTASSFVDDMNLSGLVIIPDPSYPSGPSESISLESWSRSLHTHMLASVETTQALLSLVIDFRSRVLFLTPSTSASLSLPLHTVENTVVAALDGYASTLRNELRHLGVCVHQIKLGSFDMSKQLLSQSHRGALSIWNSPRTEAHDDQEAHEATQVSQTQAKGSPLRELHWVVFDVLAGRRNSDMIRVGQGSLSYYMIGALLPQGLVGWMMGHGRHAQAGQPREARVSDSMQWEKV